MSRKNYLTNAIVGLFLLVFGFGSLPAVAKNPFNFMTSSQPNYLFIQVANSGEIVPSKNEPGTYNLILKNVDPFTSYFTDRPNRNTGLLPTKQFVALWSNDDIERTPPNVAIETSNLESGKKINRVFVLSNPTYNPAKKEIIYKAKMLDKGTAPVGHVTIGYTVLFIDDFVWNGSKFGG